MTTQMLSLTGNIEQVFQKGSYLIHPERCVNHKTTGQERRDRNLENDIYTTKVPEKNA